MSNHWYDLLLYRLHGSKLTPHLDPSSKLCVNITILYCYTGLRVYLSLSKHKHDLLLYPLHSLQITSQQNQISRQFANIISVLSFVWELSFYWRSQSYAVSINPVIFSCNKIEVKCVTCTISLILWQFIKKGQIFVDKDSCCGVHEISSDYMLQDSQRSYITSLSRKECCMLRIFEVEAVSIDCSRFSTKGDACFASFKFRQYLNVLKTQFQS